MSMNKIEDLFNPSKLSDLMHKQQKQDKDKWCKVLCIAGIIAAAAAIAYGIYRYMKPKCRCMDDFEDSFEDDLEDDFFEDETAE